jgi:cobyric acid synthase
MGTCAADGSGRPLGHLTSGDGEPRSESCPDGGIDAQGLVLGTYVHGLLHEPQVREALLSAVARLAGRELPPPGPEQSLDAELDRLTDHFAGHVDLSRIAGWVGLA